MDKWFLGLLTQGEIYGVQELTADIAKRLVKRAEDYPQVLEDEMTYYRQEMLQPLEV